MANTFEKMQAHAMVEPEEAETPNQEQEIEIDEVETEATSEAETHESTEETEVNGVAAEDDEFEGYELEEGEKAPTKEEKKNLAWAKVKRERKAYKKEASSEREARGVAESKVELLERQIAELTRKTLKKPEYHDYDDENHFLRDMAQYQRAMLAANPQQVSPQQAAQQVSQQAQPAHDENQFSEAVDAHFQRAEDSGLNPEKFANAQRKVENELDTIGARGSGRQTVDQIVSILGNGSEKVMWVLGHNEAALDKLKNLITKDPSGFQAISYLTELKIKSKPKRKIKSNAPEPDKAPSGSSAPVSDYQKRFDKAKSTDEMFKIRREARKAGVKLH